MSRFHTLWQTRKFLDSLQRLARRQPALRQRVYRVLSRFYDRPDALDRTVIHNPKRRVFHTRVDGEKRLIDEPLDPARPNEVALLYVDHHDAANDWAARYRGDTLAMIESAVRLEQRSAATETNGNGKPPGAAGARRTRTAKGVKTATNGARRRAPELGPERSAGSVGEHVSASALRRLGVPASLVEAVLEASAEHDLTRLGLDAGVAERVGAWYASRSPLARVALPVPAAEPPEALAVGQEALRTVLTLTLPQLLASLTEQQRALARRENRKLYVIMGAAGSGKTVIGVRRVEYLVERRRPSDRPILFVCYNKVLANAARQMIEDTLGRPLGDAGVEVWTAYELLEALQRELGIPTPRKYVGPERLLALLREVRPATSPGLAGWSDQAILAEVLEVIYGRVLRSEAEYVSTDRRGRGRRLDKRQRAALWAIHERLRAACERETVAPLDELPARIVRHLAAHPVREPRYSGVVVDEAQDLLPSVFQALVRLQAGRDENMLVLGDAAQNVYRSGFRWAHTGLAVTPGQVSHLRRCFRSTRRIVGAAAPLVARQKGRLEDDLVLPEGGGDDGPPVRVTLYPGADEELDAVALDIAARIADGVAPSSIAVLLDDDDRRRALRARLDVLECRCEDFLKAGADRRIDIFDQSVKLLSVASAKGIEFQLVYVPGITADRFPSADDDGETSDRARRVLYTAMTRCAWDLRLSAVEAERSGLLAELDAAFVDRRRSSVGPAPRA